MGGWIGIAPGVGRFSVHSRSRQIRWSTYIGVVGDTATRLKRSFASKRPLPVTGDRVKRIYRRNTNWGIVQIAFKLPNVLSLLWIKERRTPNSCVQEEEISSTMRELPSTLMTAAPGCRLGSVMSLRI